MKLGIDIGSTTIKLVCLDEFGNIQYSAYARHFSNALLTLDKMLKAFESETGILNPKVALSGSLAIDLAKDTGIPFIQEVVACERAVKKYHPETDVVIELGGEDQKILFFKPYLEFRMNGSCAGGTGSFIDQMAILLAEPVEKLDLLAQESDERHIIASRCGVFAKTDVQSLMNQGVSKANISKSIFDAVAKQTIAGLAQGKSFSGKVCLLGGPLTFIKSLQDAFPDFFEDGGVEFFLPQHSELFVAIGAALSIDRVSEVELTRLKSVLQGKAENKDRYQTIKSLFETEEAYQEFNARHRRTEVGRTQLDEAKGPIWLGIDAGSTTTKCVAIDSQHHIVFEDYSYNQGKLIDTIMSTMKQFYIALPSEAYLAGIGVTGYGEYLIEAALKTDHAEVETLAHFEAAKFFEPDVDFIVDIGGQDIKCFTISNNQIDRIMINEACSSGCGSFISTFASALDYSVSEFAALALKSTRPYDLGTRCTVFMNSTVKQALRENVALEDIAAGISFSVVKNALYKVLHLTDVKQLGKHIVVQGGTFENDSVLRAFEIETGHLVKRPSISRLMGAFGIALITKKEKGHGPSHALSKSEIESFEYTTQNVRCHKCSNNCLITLCKFPDGSKYGSGNQCSKGAVQNHTAALPHIFDHKLEKLRAFDKPLRGNKTVGLPLVLNMYENMPFWVEFFYALGLDPVITKGSDRQTYEKGLSTIPSDTACYPAKLVHGHIVELLDKKVDFLFYPCMTFNHKEKAHHKNRYNCPVVAYYPENIKNNMSQLSQTQYLNPYYDLADEKHFLKAFQKDMIAIGLSFTAAQLKLAYAEGSNAYAGYKQTLLSYGQQVIELAKAENKPLIIIGGRPYHIDPEVNNGIADYISTLGAYILTEDAVAVLADHETSKVLNQWTFHARMYDSAKFAKVLDHAQVGYIQLVSFGCGLDAITTYETESIFRNSGTPFAQIKIDEIKNLGSAKLRIRSLLSQMER